MVLRSPKRNPNDVLAQGNIPPSTSMYESFIYAHVAACVCAISFRSCRRVRHGTFGLFGPLPRRANGRRRIYFADHRVLSRLGAHTPRRPSPHLVSRPPVMTVQRYVAQQLDIGTKRLKKRHRADCGCAQKRGLGSTGIAKIQGSLAIQMTFLRASPSANTAHM